MPRCAASRKRPSCRLGIQVSGDPGFSRARRILVRRSSRYCDVSSCVRGILVQFSLELYGNGNRRICITEGDFRHIGIP